ncbi:hypothetical protein ABI_46610 [Asticcacaulis biprosthecium C19]|uniref:Uncharacterized protein n=1 Tax=Asticcacaulis biprosthecium C19 TaxID=715226 RepID=F4QU14_9CAUL|nr:hypothetical protein ABI_46610 [Asticcacaulis biprosthecium C19]
MFSRSTDCFLPFLNSDQLNPVRIGIAVEPGADGVDLRNF